MNIKGKKSTSSEKKEILNIKVGNSPEKVVNEEDSLGIDATTHSFYWSWDLYKRDDYEPVAVSNNNNYCLSRLHYHGIVLWQNYTIKQGKPIVYFRSGVHTPVICSKQNVFCSVPSDILDKIVLKGYFMPKCKQMRSGDQTNYDIVGYADKFVDEGIPLESKFTWDDISYYVLVTPTRHVEKLRIPEQLKTKLFHD